MADSLAKNNHSARKTQVQTLCAAGVTDSAVLECEDKGRGVLKRVTTEFPPVHTAVTLDAKKASVVTAL